MEDYHDYLEQQSLEMLFRLHSAEAIRDFSSDRLQSAYLNDPSMPKNAVALLEKADKDSETNRAMSFLYCVIATEITLTQLLTRPMLIGLVHSDAVADIVLKLMPERVGSNDLRDLLFDILEKVANVNLKTYKRMGANLSLWEEWTIIFKARHALMHSGEMPSDEIMTLAPIVAHHFLTDVFTALLNTIGLDLNGYLLIESSTVGFIASMRQTIDTEGE